MDKPLRIIFTANGKPRRLSNGAIDEKLWTQNGHHWLKSDGAFPYDDCETRYVERRGGLSILEATPS